MMEPIVISGLQWNWQNPDSLRDALDTKLDNGEDLNNIVEDMLAVLKNPEEDDDDKCSILCGLVDVCDILLSDHNRLERINASLLSLDTTHYRSDSSFHRQIQICITAIHLEFDFFNANFEQLNIWLERLLKRIDPKNRSPVLQRRTACQCLHEFELSYPGLLARKTGHIAELCAAENSHALDAYTLLLATVLRQAVVLLTTDEYAPKRALSEADSPASLSALLNTEGENLHPYLPSRIVQDCPIPVSYERSGTKYREKEVDKIKRVLSLIVNNLSMANPPTMLASVCAMASIVKLLGVRPQVFSPIFATFISSSNLMILHAVMNLEINFPKTTLFTEAESSFLWSRLLINLNHGALTEEHYLLHLAWLSEWIRRMDVLSEEDALERCAQLLPRIFDSPEVLFRKIHMVAGLFCRVPRKLQNEADLEFEVFDKPRAIMKLLVCFSDYSYMTPTAPQVGALFRTLYALYMLESDQATILRREIYNFVLRAVIKSPKFITIAIDIGKSIFRSSPHIAIHASKPFLFALLDQLKKAMLDRSDTEIINSLPNYLVLLECLASEPDVDPATYMARLHELLRSSSLCREGNWEKGMALLEVCRVLMLSHPTTVIIKSLGDLLSLIWRSFEDIDVRDHARFYYILLTNISGDQLRDILHNRTDTVESINGIMTDNLKLSSSCEPAKPYQVVVQTFLELVRDTSLAIPCPVIHEVAEVCDFEPNDALWDVYFQNLQQAAKSAAVQVRYRVQYTEAATSDNSIPDAVYALVISFSEHPRVNTIAPIEVALLERKLPDVETLDTADIVLQLRPKEPVPVSLEARVDYSDQSGDAFTGVVAPIDLEFRDMLMPIPWPKTVEYSRFQIFQAAWCGLCAGQVAVDVVEHMETVIRLTSSPNTEYSEDCIFKELGRFCVDAQRSKDGIIHFFVGILYLPSHQILMRAQLNRTLLSVRIAADNLSILASMEQWLTTISESAMRPIQDVGKQKEG